MRLTKFLIDGCPRLKCGPAAIVPLAVASTAAQVGSAAMTNAANAEIAANQLGAQREENKLNRDWQTEEAEKNRAFQTGTMQAQQAYTTSERLASQEYQAEQWQRQFDEELSHRFDVPGNVNPAVYFSSHGAASGVGGSVSAPSGNSVASPSGSMPGTVQGLSPVPYQAQRLDFAQLLSGAGNFVSSLANAKKAGAETTDIMENLSAKVRKGIADADSAEMISALNQLHLHIQKSNLPWSLKMAELDYQQALAKIDLTKKEALTQGEQAALHVATAKMNSALSEYYSKEGQKSDITLRYLPDMLKSEILSNRASAASSYSQVGLNESLAKESGSRTSAIAADSYLTRLRNGIIAKDGIDLFESQVLDELSAQGLINRSNKFKVDLLKELTQKFKNENDWFIAKQILGEIHQTVGDIVDLKSIKIKQQGVDNEAEDIRGKYGDTHEDTYTKYDSQGRKHTIKDKYNRSGQRYKGKF